MNIFAKMRYLKRMATHFNEYFRILIVETLSEHPAYNAYSYRNGLPEILFFFAWNWSIFTSRVF